MREIKEGWYDFMGNAVKVEDGYAYDVDSGEEFPIELIDVLDFVRPLSEDDWC